MKKVARKVRVTRHEMPISTRLVRAFKRSHVLRLVRKSKAFEIGFEESEGPSAFERAEGCNFVLLLREGTSGTRGKVKKIRCRRYHLDQIAVREAMRRLASGWTMENVTIPAAILESWLAEVKRIGKSPATDWLTLSERALG